MNLTSTITRTITSTPSPTKPTGYLFLDVDGVINPLAENLTGFPDWEEVTIDRWWVQVSPSLGQWLRGLTDQGVQIVWATTWIQMPEDLATLADFFGLPLDLPTIDELEWTESSRDCGKGPGVLRWLKANQVDVEATPVAWVDDCLSSGDQLLAVATGITPVRVPGVRGLDDAGQRRRIERVFW